MDQIDFSSQEYCDATLQRRYWKNTRVLGNGRVCNAPIMSDGTCPDEKKHASNGYGDD